MASPAMISRSLIHSGLISRLPEVLKASSAPSAPPQPPSASPSSPISSPSSAKPSQFPRPAIIIPPARKQDVYYTLLQKSAMLHVFSKALEIDHTELNKWLRDEQRKRLLEALTMASHERNLQVKHPGDGSAPIHEVVHAAAGILHTVASEGLSTKRLRFSHSDTMQSYTYFHTEPGTTS